MPRKPPVTEKIIELMRSLAEMYAGIALKSS